MKWLVKSVFLACLVLGLMTAGGGFSHADQQIKTPKSDTAFQYQQYGYLEVHDDQETDLGGIYALLVYTRKNVNSGQVELHIRSKFAQGTVFTEEKSGETAWEMAQDGETMRLWGQPFKPYNAQDRRRIEYRFYQKDGKPQKIELYVVARDKDGQAKEPKTLEIPWMLPPYERPQVLKLPKDQKPFRYTKVGYLEAKDALETGRRGVYAWLVYVREDTVKKEKELHIMSHLRPPGNSYFTEKKANETAVRMEARGEDMKLWGIPFHGNSDKDLRKMEYRFYQKNGKPHQLEIFAVTRNRDQSAKPAQSLRIDWPW